MGSCSKDSSKTEDKVLPAAALTSKFPTGGSFDLKPMTLDQFKMFFSGYLVVTSGKVALTSEANVKDGNFLEYVPKWSIVKMLTPTKHTDRETKNTRRNCQVEFFNNASLASKAAAAAAEGEDNKPDYMQPGFITTFDLNEKKSNVKAYGVVDLTSPVTLVKETVFTSAGEISGGALKPIRRLKTGEKLEIVSLPVLTTSNLLRIRCRALKDGASGYFTAYDNKNDIS